jgi:1-acyl-sn-glycerol-3-phosphate acyltransferase
MLRTLLQPFYTLYVLISFLISLILTFPVFLWLGTQRKPKARKRIWKIVHSWSLLWLRIIGMPLSVSGRFPADKRYIIVANHISYLDTINIYAAIPDYFRTLAKKEMAKVPLFGFIYSQLTILVDRNHAESRAKSMRLMWRQLKQECHITIFPEGGFNETGATLKPFYDGAFRLALQTRTDIIPLLLPDTVDRWHYSGWWKLYPGRNRAVFLDPISVSEYTLADLPQLKKKVFGIMESELNKIYCQDVKS